MVTIQDNKHRILHRLKIVRGHLEKIIEMVEKDTYCIEILNQSLAVQKALKSLDATIMEEHLSTCAIDQIKKGKKNQFVQELIDIYKYK